MRPEDLQFDVVQKPKHYNTDASGIECIDLVEHLGFNCGNAVKYVWRKDEKNGLEDVKKSLWYVERESSQGNFHVAPEARVLVAYLCRRFRDSRPKDDPIGRFVHLICTYALERPEVRRDRRRQGLQPAHHLHSARTILDGMIKAPELFEPSRDY